MHRLLARWTWPGAWRAALHASWAGLASPVRRQLVLVLAVGLVVRAFLIPMGHGQDFVVWDKASAATLGGVDVYAHHPDYPGGPYAYFPLFLYVELPFQWLSVHLGLPFTVLGKLPILFGDLAVATLIAAELRDRGRSGRAVTLGAAAFFLNPLVIYSSAYYGRFDTCGLALLLLSLRQFRHSRRGAPWVFALAVAMKTFPVFLLPAVLWRFKGQRLRTLVSLAATLVILSLPYLGTLSSYLRDIVRYDAVKSPQGLSWQTLLGLPTSQAIHISYLLLVGFAIGAVLVARINDLDRCVAVTLVLFVLASKVVVEQYLIWPLPWLILLACAGPRGRTAPAVVTMALSVIGLVTSETFHPWGRWPVAAIIAVVCVCCLYVASTVRDASVRVHDLDDRRENLTERPSRASSPV